MHALDGQYAPTILTVRMRHDTAGHEKQARPYYRLVHITEGSMQLTVAGVTYKVQTGDICLLPPTVDVDFLAHQETRSQAIAFTIMACPIQRAERHHARKMAPGCPPQPAPEAIWGCRLPVVQTEQVSVQIRSLIALIVTESWHSEAQRLMCQQRLSFVLERIVWPHLHIQTHHQPPSDHPIERVHALIRSRLANLHTAGDIAAHLGISLSQLNKSYSAAARDETPAGFLRRYRLAEATRLMLQTDHALAVIAQMVGYRNDKALYKAWMREHEQPPHRWRQAQRYR